MSRGRVRPRVLVRAFKRWFERHVGLALAPPGPAQKSPQASLRELLASTRVPDILDWPVAAFDPGMQLGLATGEDLLEDVAYVGVAGMREVTRAVTGFVARLETQRIENRKQPALIEQLPVTGDEGLDRLLRAVATARQPTLDVWPPELLGTSCQAAFDGEVLRLNVKLSRLHEAAIVELPELALWGMQAKVRCN